MKKCKYCQTEIDKKAKICPNCHKSQSNKLVRFIVVSLIIIFCVVACVNSCANGVNDAINEVTNKKDYLKIDESSVTNSKDEYGFSYYIEGYIENVSDEKFDYVQITYTTYDSEGNTLGTCIDNNAGLDAKGRWKFKAICLEEVDNISSYKLTEITGY